MCDAIAEIAEKKITNIWWDNWEKTQQKGIDTEQKRESSIGIKRSLGGGHLNL